MKEYNAKKVCGKQIRLVVSDLDGTLLNQYNEISVENYQAITALKDAGILFSFATGRLDIQTKLYIEQLQLDAPIISCNGALIRTGLTHEILHLQRMAPAMAAKTLSFAAENGLDYLAYDTDEIFYPESSERVSAYKNYNRVAEQMNSKPCPITQIDLQRDLEAIAGRICKIYLHSDVPGRIGACRQFVEQETDLIAVSSMGNNLDVAPPGQTKGSAVHWLAKHYGLTREELCVFGDNENDVSMLREAGLSFAMQNATALAKAAADHVVPSNNTSGVGRALRQFILP